MATKSETTTFSWLGASLNVLAGYNQAKLMNQPFTFEKFVGRAALGALSGAVVAEIFGEPNDTVNYTCYQGKKLVYHGITYKDRVKKREFEHKRNGKKFNRIEFDDPKPRSEARLHEMKTIRKFKPKYNIHHNMM
jgi:hypothetical protein